MPKKMYKKRDARGKTFFCQSKPISIAFLPFMLPLLSSSSFLKLPIVHKRVCFVNDVNKTTTFFRLVDVFHKNVIKGQMNQKFDIFYFSSILVKCV